MSELYHDRIATLKQAGLYLVTSQVLSGGRTTLDIIRAARAGGVTLIQLREKGLSTRALTSLAHEARRLTRAAGALLIINDRLDVALATDADGVHLGQDDLPIREARELAPLMIIGASSHNAEEAVEAEHAGASYVNIGPLFPTQTKDWTGDFLGVEGLQAVAPHVSIPFTVMGGIKQAHIPELVAAGARTIALVTAVTQAQDPEAAAKGLLEAILSQRANRP